MDVLNDKFYKIPATLRTTPMEFNKFLTRYKKLLESKRVIEQKKYYDYYVIEFKLNTHKFDLREIISHDEQCSNMFNIC